MVLWTKACPKCGGDLYSDRDIMGYYRQCLQCGHTLYEERRRPLRDRSPAASHSPLSGNTKTGGPAGQHP